MNVETYKIEQGSLVRREANGRVAWRRHLGAYTIGHNKYLKQAIIRQSGDVLRVICQGVEIRVHAENGKIQQVARRTHFGRKKNQADSWSIEDLLKSLGD